MSWLSTAEGAIGSLVGGGLGMIGQNAQNQANAKQVAQQEQFQSQQAQIARDYNTQMANTSWQRGVADMKAAGLNPALAYQQGGASSPTSMSPSGAAAQMGNVMAAGISSAKSTADTLSQLQGIKVQQAQEQQVLAGADLNQAQADNIKTLTAAQLAELQSRTSGQTAQAAKTALEGDYLGNTMALRIEQERNRTGQSAESALQAHYSAQLTGTEATLAGLGVPAAKNAAAAAQTWWGRKISPFMNDAQATARMFSPYILPMVTPP